MFLMIDNYDSFTYNLVHLLSMQGADIRVVRNDRTTLAEIEDRAPEGLILSPGPGRPQQAGICMDAIRRFAPTLPILGVCLGHQSIAAAFDGNIIRADRMFHGKGSLVYHDRKGVFAEVKEPFYAMRYHSLLVERKSLPDCLEVTAQTEDGEIMGIRHKEFPVFGMQFHPESIMAEEGARLVKNFLNAGSHGTGTNAAQ